MGSQNNVKTVDYFADSLWLEDGLSKNTLDSYRRDLHLFSVWLSETQNITSLSKDSNEHILGYLAYCFDCGKKTKNYCEMLISVKAFLSVFIKRGKVKG